MLKNNNLVPCILSTENMDAVFFILLENSYFQIQCDLFENKKYYHLVLKFVMF